MPPQRRGLPGADQVGIDWFESEYLKYKEQLLNNFPDAPDIDLN